MFASLRLNIFIYYLVTVVVFVSIGYYFLVVLKIENIFLLTILFLCFAILSGIYISKLAVDPLKEYIVNLQNLSKETLHELNLPIATIKTNSQMLKKNLTQEKEFKRLGRIESACDMLQERYNELEYMIKMQSKAELSEEFFLEELVEERVAFLQRIYPYFEFELELSSLKIKSDKKGLSKVIDNIIDNGVKYSTDTKKLKISMQESSLSIQDYGIGMDEVELLQIFDNYYQKNSNIQGFGIGLSMVKRYCDKNDIGLSFVSKKEYGTKVELQFKNIIGS